MGNLSGKVALVTGSSRGIGRGIAERLARDGALVAVHYGSNEAAAEETAAAIAEAGGRAFLVGAQLGVPGDVDTLMAGLEAGLRAHGEPAVDILVHNAGLNLMGRPIEVLTPEEFDQMVAVNIKAPFFLTQRLLPRLRDGGRIINISSVSTRIASAHGIGYPLTKGALEVFSHTLAKHLGPRAITVNSVIAGFTRTDMTAAALADPANLERNISLTALGRIGQIPDIADTVAFLASDDARWITGAKIDVTGGVNL
ncbi:NAD(P)-dependent dehydrogenase, short-chain alcohol dehydrogenase family [Streptomyces sp. 2224.1]|uniref:SDR family oxidoreductase n=1 Tax=Streptomyces sp. 2224.1 TaxID=1881020 RepID=UPI00089CA36B|nr:SDR family oxidoreductase [Streptomyces sp. 2224.1]SED74773.1 NAD(P)-dependent dehydrogenase, short-chain alcohol dehydrogenase family [Streptomyces sp. 2224.1]